MPFKQYDIIITVHAKTRWIQYTPPSNFVGQGYNNMTAIPESMFNSD